MSQIDQIKEILNPPLVLVEEEGLEWVVDRSLSANLRAAIQDIESGLKDEVLLVTLQSVLERLERLETLLESKQEIHKTTFNYLISP